MTYETPPDEGPEPEQTTPPAEPETPPDEAPEPEQTTAPAEPDESPFEPFETEDFLGSDLGGDVVELSDDSPAPREPDPEP